MEFVTLHLSATPTKRELKLADALLALLVADADVAGDGSEVASAVTVRPSEPDLSLPASLDRREAPPVAPDPGAAFGVAAPPLADAPGASLRVPSVSTVQPAVGGPAAPVELDPDGLPWDARIHAGTKGRNNDGRWKGKKGVEDRHRESVLQELRLVYPEPSLKSLVSNPAAGPIVKKPQAPPAPGAVPAPPAVTAPGGPSDGTFVGFMRKITPLLKAQSITQRQLREYCAAIGLGEVHELAKSVEHIPTVEAMIDAAISP